MSDSPADRSHPFAALVRYSSFRLLWSSGVIMQASEWIQSITLGWLALNLTNSAAFVGRVNALLGLPLLLLSAPAGMLLDRVDRRRTLLACQLCGAALALAVAATVARSTLAPWHLLVTAVLNGTLIAITVPTVQSLVPGLVAREDLTNALGLSAAGTSSTRIIGPSLGGALIGGVGSAGAFAVQGIGMLLAAVLSFRVRPELAPTPAGAVASADQDGVLAYLRHNPLIVALLLQAVAPSLLAYPVLALLPVLARDHLGLDAAGLGLLMAASGTGAVVGSVAIASLGRYPHKGRLLAVLGVIYGGVMTAFVQTPWPLLAGLLFGCSSCVGIAHNALTWVLLQERVPETRRGQITGLLTLSFGLSPIGALGLSELAARIGADNAITCGALSCSVAIALVVLWRRQLLEL